MGVIFQSENDYERSIKLYKKSINLFPESHEAYSNLSRILLETGQYDLAETYLIKVINLNLNHTNYNKFFMKKKSTGALIVAAGKGIRSESIVPKQYLYFGHKNVLEKNIENFINEPLIDFVIVVINEDHLEFYEKTIARINNPKLLPKCFGGKTRSQSVKNGLKAISEIGCKKILIQDGARPFTSNEIIKNCIT